MVGGKKYCARIVSALLIFAMCMNLSIMPVFAEEEIEALKVETIQDVEGEMTESPQVTAIVEATEEKTPEEGKETEEEQKLEKEEPTEQIQTMEGNGQNEPVQEAAVTALEESAAPVAETKEPEPAAEGEAQITGKTECSVQPEVTVTVSPEQPKDEETVQPEETEPLNEAALGALLTDLAGWELLDENGNILGVVQADGTVQSGDKKIPLAFVADGNGSYTLELVTAPKTGEIKENENGQKEQETTQREKKITVTVVNGRTVVGYWRGKSGSVSNELQMAEPDEELLSQNDQITNETLNEKHLCKDEPAEEKEYEALGEFRYTGYGIASTVTVHRDLTGAKENIAVHQFRLVDGNGKFYYAYCADLAETAYPGKYYEMTNVEEADYYQGENGAKHIQTVCANGYWGTKNEGNTGEQNAMGSLAAVQALLRTYRDLLKQLKAQENLTAKEMKLLEELSEVERLSDEQIASLDDGFALAATQAAIWKFGNHHGDQGFSENPLQAYGKTSGWDATETIGEEQDETVRNRTLMQQAAGNALYKLLISDYLMDQTAQTATELIRLEDIESASITVKDKVDTQKLDEAVREALGDRTNDVYTTDLSFAMAVIPDAEKDSILVRIYCDGKVIATRRLAGENAVGENYGMIVSDGNGNYTIENIQLPEGMKISLRLEGVQHLNPGVYLYQSEGSQNFIGLSTGDSKRNLELEIAVEFQVKDAEQRIRVENDQKEEKKTWEEKKSETVTAITTISEPQPLQVPVYAKSVQTGDGALLWWAPVMAAAAGMLILLERKRKNPLHFKENML